MLNLCSFKLVLIAYAQMPLINVHDELAAFHQAALFSISEKEV